MLYDADMTHTKQWWPLVVAGSSALAGLGACEADLETRCVGGDGTCDAADYAASASSTSAGVMAGPSGSGGADGGGSGPGGADGVGGAGGD